MNDAVQLELTAANGSSTAGVFSKFAKSVVLSATDNAQDFGTLSAFSGNFVPSRSSSGLFSRGFSRATN